MLLNIAVQWLSFLLHIREVTGSKSRPGNRLSWLRCSWFSSVSPGKFLDILKLVQDRFLPHPFQFIIHLIYHPINRRYIVWVTEKASLNKLHTTIQKFKQAWLCVEKYSSNITSKIDKLGSSHSLDTVWWTCLPLVYISEARFFLTHTVHRIVAFSQTANSWLRKSIRQQETAKNNNFLLAGSNKLPVMHKIKTFHLPELVDCRSPLPTAQTTFLLVVTICTTCLTVRNSTVCTSWVSYDSVYANKAQ
jgi:hypothetical protein